jgi:hypothetical protein
MHRSASRSFPFIGRTATAAVTFCLAWSLATIVLAGHRDDDDDEDSESSRGPVLPLTEITPGFLRAPYLQSLGADSVLVAWMASDAAAPAVEYGTTPEFGTTVTATSDGNRRVAVLRGLAPGTRYYYRVRAGDRVMGSNPPYSFSTDAGPSDRSFTFFATGDVGDGDGQQAYTASSILRAEPRPEMGIIAGDVVYSAGRSSDYDRNLMRPWRDLFANLPVWPALGNHDWKSPPDENWSNEWYLPNNEHYYSFDYANAHFVALDTRDGDIYDAKNQVAWLEKDLQSHAGAGWVFVYFHHPGITCTYKKNNTAVIANFLPVFDRYKVDVVFMGHAHTYERLYPLRDGRPVDVDQDPHYTDPDGTLYVVSGAGGKVKKGKHTKRCGPTAFARDETILWTSVQVDGSKCTIRSYESRTDKLVDEVTLTKSRIGAATTLGSR